MSNANYVGLGNV